ncbi:MAG: tRNA isopentenyl-2-thiomethyl-A-37 hydroxylase MiaE [Sandaracinus sp.]
MLGLLTPTLPTWVEAVERDLDRLLQDHAHCELKAAQSALSLAARFGGEAPDLVAPLLALAQEESEHVAMVHERLRARGRTLSLPDQDDYVVMLRRAANEARSGQPALLDRLLVSALVEARSCERFKLLSERLNDASLRAFYKELMASEARHYRLFVGAAEARFGEGETRTRLSTLATREAEIVGHLPLGPTVHG